jgi:formylglycine-generating enzyme required for sulfatase activity
MTARASSELGPVVLLPAGIAVVDEVPRRVPLPALLFDRHEVCIGQYRLCVAADACTVPEERIPVYATAPDDWPVVNVTANEAFGYCRWLGRRLPTVEEWERAARGLDGRPFPWETGGPEASRVNAAAADGSVAPGPVPVGDRRFAAGDTPEGIAHLIGNVEEWTSTEMVDTAEAPGREVGVWEGG